MSLLSGWFEPKRPTPEGEWKAPDHRDAALRAQMQNQTRDTLRVPLPAPEKKIEIKTCEGWARGMDNAWLFEKSFSKNNVDTVSEDVFKGRIFNNHGSLTVFHYSRDVSELSGLMEKAEVLEGRLSALCIDDSGFPEISKSLYETKKRIKELKKCASAHENSELILEDTFHGAQDTDEYKSWAEGFMRQCLGEVDRLTGHKSHVEDSNDKEKIEE